MTEFLSGVRVVLNFKFIGFVIGLYVYGIMALCLFAILVLGFGAVVRLDEYAGRPR